MNLHKRENHGAAKPAHAALLLALLLLGAAVFTPTPGHARDASPGRDLGGGLGYTLPVQPIVDIVDFDGMP
ncbi:MAG: hypothetical protein FWJ61_09455 [Limnochordales bacterium]